MGDDERLIEVTGHDAVLDEIFRLRLEVWRAQAEFRAGMEAWRDTHDEHGRHWAILAGGVVIAAVRMCIHDEFDALPDAEVYDGVLPRDIPMPVAAYNRMFVDPKHRGRGLSRILDDVCIASARASGATYLVGSTGSVSCNVPRVATMVRRGFSDLGKGRRYDNAPFEADAAPNVLVLDLR